jgi:hypothetical protein
MKKVKFTMEVIIDDESPAEVWMYNSISDQLEVNESITDFDYQVVELNVEPV